MCYICGWLRRIGDPEEKRIPVGQHLAHMTEVFLTSKVCRLYNSAVREDRHSS